VNCQLGWPAQPATNASATRRHRKELPPRLQRLAHAAVVTSDGSHPMVKVDPAATGFTKVVLGPCHYRAIHSGHDRSRADNHGQRHGALDLRRFPTSQVTTSPDLALGAGGRFVQATIGVAAWSGAPSQHRGGSEGHPWMAMSSGGHLRVRPVDPRDTAWEVNAPAYRVYFLLQPPGPPPSGEEQMAWVSDEYEVEDADVAVVLEWANSKASPGQTFTLYALAHCNGMPGLVRLAGTDPTAPSRDER
jgi:hypothetical protein